MNTTYYRTQWINLLQHLQDFIYQEQTQNDVIECVRHFIILTKLANHEIRQYEDNICLAIANTGLDCADLIFSSLLQISVTVLGNDQTIELITHTNSLDPFLFNLREFNDFVSNT